jgi:hypothetical protein
MKGSRRLVYAGAHQASGGAQISKSVANFDVSPDAIARLAQIA